jgi:hypothetical protein
VEKLVLVSAAKYFRWIDKFISIWNAWIVKKRCKFN